MSQWKKVGLLAGVVTAWLWISMTAVSAQTPRPTPTMDPGITNTPTPTPAPPATATPQPPPAAAGAQHLGTIRGAVYEDVNSDGRCIGTGVAAEKPVAGVTIEFVSSDGQTVVHLTSGEDGLYGLAAAGYSFWAVSAQGGSAWVVTSDKTRTVPIFEDSRVATDVNFCVQQAGTARVLLPVSGTAGGTAVFSALLLAGVALLLLGTGWQLQARRRDS